MADTAFKTLYREEFIPAYEAGQSMLRTACTTEANVKGNQAIFLVAGTGSASAVTRGPNGKIPSRPNSYTQNTCTLQEWHDKPEESKFSVDMGQSDHRRIMREGSIKVLNRKVNSDIIAQLDTATVTTGAAATASLQMVTKALAILGNSDVPIEEEDNMFGVITPGFRSYLMQIKEFANADYVEVKPFSGPAKKYLRWSGVNWMVNTQLTGAGTSSEKCYLFHRGAIGHAMDMEQFDIDAGYNSEDSYYWSRTSGFLGSKKLQDSGIVQMLHDGSAFATS